jgi:hypothetical protein
MKFLSLSLLPILVAIVAVLILVGIVLPGVATSGANNPPTTTTAITPISTSPQAQGSLAGGDPTCAKGTTCMYTLTVENSGLASSCPGAQVSVVINNIGSFTMITATVLKGTSSCTPQAVFELGYNGGSSTFTSASCGTWNNVGPKTLDGFGSFNNVFMSTENSIKCTSVTFTLNALVTSFGTSSGGFVFAVHAVYDQATGFIATPVYPIGDILAVLGPLAAVGIYFGARKGFKF